MRILVCFAYMKVVLMGMDIVMKSPIRLHAEKTWWISVPCRFYRTHSQGVFEYVASSLPPFFYRVSLTIQELSGLRFFEKNRVSYGSDSLQQFLLHMRLGMFP